MSRPDDDTELAEAFTALRREEEEQCPSFAEVRRRAQTRSRRSVVRRRALVAAAAVAGIAIALLAAWIGLRTEEPPRQPVPSIAEWRSPTGILLETPGREILSAPSGLGGTVLDFASPTKGRSPS
jgi:hypothetical protein